MVEFDSAPSTAKDTAMADDTLELLAASARDYVAREMAASRPSDDVRDDVFTAHRWRQLVELGWAGLLVPELFGGHAQSLRHLAVVLEAFARRGIHTPLIQSAAEVPVVLLASATPEQSSELFSRMIDDGDVLVSAFWERPFAHELGSVSTTAERFRGGFRLTGEKVPVSHALIADAFIVLARFEGSDSFGLFVVDAMTEGLKVDRLSTTNDDNTGVVQLHGAWIRDGDRLDAGDAVAAVWEANLVGSILTSVELYVLAARSLELTLEYVQQRRQFDRQIGSFQAVHHHCADMYRDVEGMRVACESILNWKPGVQLPAREVSLTKALTSTKARQVLERAHQLHGGVGYYADYPLERLYRRSIASQGAFGSAVWHRARLIETLQRDPKQLRRHPGEV